VPASIAVAVTNGHDVQSGRITGCEILGVETTTTMTATATRTIPGDYQPAPEHISDGISPLGQFPRPPPIVR
jgi:hypothetical protein